MKIVFIGCVKSSEILLNTLIKIHSNVVGVITKQSSLINSDFVDLKTLCDKNSIDCRYVEDINNSEIVEYIKRKQPDVIYCFGWSQLIKEEILKIPSRGVVGFHPAQLPNNRGRHPIIWTLALGLEETASTFFMMDIGADTGHILSQKIVEVRYEDDADSLYNKIMKVAVKQVGIFTKELEEDKQKLVKQEGINTNNWRRRGPKDGEIDWRMSSRGIYNLVRALTKPYVGAHVIYNNKEVKMWKVREVIDQTQVNIEPGKVIEVYSKTSFLIKAGENLIHVLECSPITVKKGDYL